MYKKPVGLSYNRDIGGPFCVSNCGVVVLCGILGRSLKSMTLEMRRSGWRFPLRTGMNIFHLQFFLRKHNVFLRRRRDIVPEVLITAPFQNYLEKIADTKTDAMFVVQVKKKYRRFGHAFLQKGDWVLDNEKDKDYMQDVFHLCKIWEVKYGALWGD